MIAELLMAGVFAHGVITASDPIFQQWADEAHVPTASATVVQEGSREYSATTIGATIHWAYDSGATHDFALSRPLLYHELGHVYDFTTLSNRRRLRIGKILYGFSWLWDREWFAMAYSYCALGAYPWPGWFGYGYGPPAAKQRRVCHIIRRGG